MSWKARIAFLLLMAFAGIQTYELHETRYQLREMSMAARLFQMSADVCLDAVKDAGQDEQESIQ